MKTIGELLLISIRMRKNNLCFGKRHDSIAFKGTCRVNILMAVFSAINVMVGSRFCFLLHTVRGFCYRLKRVLTEVKGRGRV